MSTTGNPRVGRPKWAVIRKMVRRQIPTLENADRSEHRDVPRRVRADLRRRRVPAAGRAVGRAQLPSQRHVAPAGGDHRQPRPHRTRCGGLRVPTLVIHGMLDPLVQPSGGYATARAIPGARLVMFNDMAHDLPRTRWNEIADEIAAIAARAPQPVGVRRRDRPEALARRRRRRSSTATSGWRSGERSGRPPPDLAAQPLAGARAGRGHEPSAPVHAARRPRRPARHVECDVTVTRWCAVLQRRPHGAARSRRAIEVALGWRADAEQPPAPEPWTTPIDPFPYVDWIGHRLVGRRRGRPERPCSTSSTAFYRYGYVVLRNTPAEEGTVRRVCDRLGYISGNNFGWTFDVRAEPQPTDLAYTHDRPAGAHRSALPATGAGHPAAALPAQRGAGRRLDARRRAGRRPRRWPRSTLSRTPRWSRPRSSSATTW